MNFQITPPEKGREPRIAGVLDIYGADALRGALMELVQSRPQLSLDLSGVESCDLVGLQLLCSARKTAAQGGGALRFLSPSPAVTAVAEALGLSLTDLSSTGANNTL